MPTTGFLGTRADVLIDLALVVFVAAPFLMTYALRLAARHRYRDHRNLQASLLAGAIVAVILLEVSIRYGPAAAAFRESAYYGTSLVRWLFLVHLAVAIPCFVCWCVLVGVSWRRFRAILPGAFSRSHRRWGHVTYVGLWLTCATGVALYVLSFAL